MKEAEHIYKGADEYPCTFADGVVALVSGASTVRDHDARGGDCPRFDPVWLAVRGPPQRGRRGDVAFRGTPLCSFPVSRR